LIKVSNVAYEVLNLDNILLDNKAGKSEPTCIWSKVDHVGGTMRL